MKKYTISLKELSLFLVFWLFYPPGYMTTALSMAGILNTLKYVVSIGLLLLSLVKQFRKKTRPSGLSVLIVLFYIQLLVATIINRGSLFDCFRYILPPVAVIIYYECCRNNNRIHLIRALFWIHFAFMIVNLLTVLFFPNGLYSVQGVTTENYYFLGHNNAVARFLLPGVFYAILYDYIEIGKPGWKSFLMSIASFLTVTLTWSNTGMVGLGIMLLFLFLITTRDMPGIFTGRNAFILSVVLFIVVVLNNNLGMFDFVIEKVFHKEVTLTGRTFLWNAILAAIAKRPWAGYGYGVSIADIYTTSRYVASSAHNYFLDLLLRGGIPHLVIQVLIVIVTYRSVDKTHTKHDKLRQLMIATLLSYFVMWQFEPFVNSGYIDMMLVFMIMTTVSTLLHSDDQTANKQFEKRAI